MTEKQAAVISQMAYLDKPSDANTLFELRKHYLDLWNSDKENKEYQDNLESYASSFSIIEKDPYLRNLKISGYENDNGKSGFVGYAFSDNSGQGVVAFRGTEPGTLEDWVPENVSSAVLLETPQLKKAKEFMQNQAGDFSSIQLAGHSLGGRLAGQVALLDDRATDAYTFNAPGVSDAFFDATIWADRSKIHAYNTQYDYVSPFLNPLAPVITIKGVEGVEPHDARNFTEGDFETAAPINNLLRPVYDTVIDLFLQPTVIGKTVDDYGDFGRSLIGQYGLGMNGTNKEDGNMQGENNQGGFLSFDETITKLEEFKERLSEVWTEISESFTITWNPISLFFSEVMPGTVEGAKEKWNDWSLFWSGIWDSVKNIFTVCWDNIVLFFTETIPGVIEGAKEKWNDWSLFWSEIWDSVKNFFTDCWDNIVLFFTETIPGIIEGAKEKWNDWSLFWSGIWDSVKSFFTDCWDGIIAFATEKLPSFVDTVVTYFQELPDKIWEWLSGAIDKVGEWASGLISKAQEVLPGAVENIKNHFSALPDKLLQIGKDMVSGIFNGISDMSDWLYNKLKGWADNIVRNVKGLFGINSPSKVMRDAVGAPIAEGIAVGITNNLKLVSDAMAGVESVIAGSALTVEPEVSDKGMDFERFKEKLRPSLDFVKAQVAYAQDAMNLRISAAAQLAAAKTSAAISSSSTYNNQSYHYTIQSNGYSPKATADAIKKQMTMQRMLFAN